MHVLKKKEAAVEGGSEASEGKADDESHRGANHSARALEGPTDDTLHGPMDARFDMLEATFHASEATFHADQRDIKARCRVPPHSTMS